MNKIHTKITYKSKHSLLVTNAIKTQYKPSRMNQVHCKDSKEEEAQKRPLTPPPKPGVFRQRIRNKIFDTLECKKSCGLRFCKLPITNEKQEREKIKRTQHKFKSTI